MSSSALTLPTGANTLSTIRYYTNLDPYFYTVDNRPLGDLESSTSTLVSGPLAALFRAQAADSVLQSAVTSALFPVNSYGYAAGLTIGYPSAGNLTVAPGALFYKDVVNTSVSTQIVKKYLMPLAQSFSVPAPSTAGQSIVYLVQAKAVSLDASTMAASNIPFMDATNAFLPGLMVDGELRLSLVVGTAATTGSQVTPAADSGAIPLYAITVAYGGTMQVSLPSGAPARAGISSMITPTLPASGAAATSTVNGFTVPAFADGSSTSVNLLIPLSGTTVNPYAPIKLSLTLASSVANNNAAFQITYLAVGSGVLSTASGTTRSIDALAMSSTANTSVVLSTTNSVIPNNAFSGLDASNVWSVTKSHLLVQLTRVGADSSDTNTGDVTLLGVSAYQ